MLALLKLILLSYMIKIICVFWEENQIVILYWKVYKYFIVTMAYINN